MCVHTRADQLLQVQGRVLPPPVLEYKSMRGQPHPFDVGSTGAWNLRCARAGCDVGRRVRQ
jgi:hypothetical protein